MSKVTDYYNYKHPELPLYLNELTDKGKFDAQFFKVNYRMADELDPVIRKLLEHTYQALFDAGGYNMFILHYPLDIRF